MLFGNIWNNSETLISRNNLEGLIYWSWRILTLLYLRLTLDQILNNFSSSILSFQDYDGNLIVFIDCSSTAGNRRQVPLSSVSWAESQSLALGDQPAKTSDISFLAVQHSWPTAVSLMLPYFIPFSQKKNFCLSYRQRTLTLCSSSLTLILNRFLKIKLLWTF